MRLLGPLFALLLLAAPDLAQAHAYGGKSPAERSCSITVRKVRRHDLKTAALRPLPPSKAVFATAPQPAPRLERHPALCVLNHTPIPDAKAPGLDATFQRPCSGWPRQWPIRPPPATA